jgi:hypothetical protein
MKFQEADEKLKELANNKFYSITYCKICHHDNSTKIECSAVMYVNEKMKNYSGSTWQEVIDKFIIELVPKVEQTPEEAPLEINL